MATIELFDYKSIQFLILTMNRSLKTLLLIAILAAFLPQIILSSNAPTPFCKSKPLFHQFPMMENETLMHDMSESFSGYNLQIKLKSNNSFAKIEEKLSQLDKKQLPIPGIISHKVQHKGNDWGKQAFILFKDKQGIKLSYGQFQNSKELPKLDYTAIITNATNTTCFDAVLFFAQGLAMIDCVEEDNTAIFDRYKNYFYYLDLTNHKIIRKAYNHLFVGFQYISKRKTFVYSNTQTGELYFLRSYFANGVDAANKQNTFMEIYLASDAQDLQLIQVVDRTYLHLATLAIVDVKLYLDDIFFLDQNNGLFRLDIQKNQQVAITGRYNRQGFTKFAVYSDDLENQLIVALANKHAIYQVQWHNSRNPVLINKYSLMENSQVHQMILNDRFVIVQSSSSAQNSTSNDFSLNYTWVFTKGSRTYSHAHLVFNHPTKQTQIQFNRKNDQLILADSEGMTLYLLGQARLQLNQHDSSKTGTSEEVIIQAVSTDFYSADKPSCIQKFTVFFVQPNQMKLWLTGIQPPTNYSFNYPGQLRLPLDLYAMGPLIDYEIKNPKSQEVPTHWINKINQTAFSINQNVTPGDITFFYTEVIPQIGEDTIIYYYQQNNNVTKVAECLHLWEAAKVSCRVQASYSHSSHILHFASAYFTDDQGWNYFYIMSLQGNTKGLFIIDYIRHQKVGEINYIGDLEAKIGGIASSNGYLYVLLPYIKTINVYKLKNCVQFKQCPLEFKIDAFTLKDVGVDYFAPKQIITDRAHPEVLFIKCLGTMVILDIDNKEQITLLDEIKSTATKDQFYKVAVNQWRMVLVAQPNIIEEYSLQLIYIKNSVFLVKNLPIYGFTIPPTADIEFSDMSDTIYINAIDPASNKSVILIYRPGYPGVNTLYQEIQLDKIYSRPELEIEVSGFFVNFLSVKTGNSFTVYRVFGEPMLSVENAFYDFDFDLTFSNPTSKLQSKPVSVQVVNFPSGFIPTQQFNTTMSNFKVDTHGNYTWKDRKWFDGHVLNYNYSCEECKDRSENPKVRVREHVDMQRTLHVGSTQYIQTFSGGISVWQDLFRWNINGTVRSVHNLPDQKLSEYCGKIASTYDDLFTVTACTELGRGVNLYVTSFASHKAFTWGPYKSDAYFARNIKIVQDILMVVDTSAYPEYKYFEGAVFLYQLSFDQLTSEEMDELEVIDSNDFLGAHGWDNDVAYLGNADLIYSSNTQAWRLYVTEVTSGFFVIDFKRKAREQQISIVSTEFLDMKDLLQKSGFNLPNDASFEAIVRTRQIYNPYLDIQNVVVTIKGYHNFEVSLIWDDKGHLASAVIHRVFYRYGYYETFNEVRSVPGFVAIGYTIPPLQQYYTNYTRQVIAIYDTNDYEHQSQKGYSERYMIGALTMNHSAAAMFNFNSTYDFESNGTRVGIIAADPLRTALYHASISLDLMVQFQKDFKDQTLTLTPYNDFHSFSFNVSLINPDEEVTEEILIIIIVVLCVLITIFFAGYVIILIRRKKLQNEQPEQRESLLTEEESILNRESMDHRVGENQGYQTPLPQNNSASGSSSSSDSDQDQESSDEEKEKVKQTKRQDVQESPKEEQKKQTEQQPQQQGQQVRFERAEEEPEKQSEVQRQAQKEQIENQESSIQKVEHQQPSQEKPEQNQQ